MFLINSIEIRKTKRKGRGVFATSEIAGGTVIADYIGIMRPSEEEREYDHDMVYDMWYSDKADICPDTDTPGMHYVNYSCEPNCAVFPLKRRTLLYALRTIFPGEELSYDYLIGEQDEDEDMDAENCHCGSDFCRGSMYTPERIFDAWDKMLEKAIKGTSETPPVAFGKILPPLKKYPTNIEDNPLFPIFGSRKRTALRCDDATLLSSSAAVRKVIRKTGRRLHFPDLNIIADGVMHFGQIIIAPVTNKKKR